MESEPVNEEAVKYLVALKKLEKDENRRGLWKTVVFIHFVLSQNIDKNSSPEQQLEILEARASEYHGKVASGEIIDEMDLDALKLLVPKGPPGTVLKRDILIGLYCFSSIFSTEDIEEYQQALYECARRRKRDKISSDSTICQSLAADIRKLSVSQQFDILEARAREYHGKVASGEITDETELEALKLLVPKGPRGSVLKETTQLGLAMYLWDYPIKDEAERYREALRLDRYGEDGSIGMGICVEMAFEISNVEDFNCQCDILDARAREFQRKVASGEITDERKLRALKLLVPKGPIGKGLSRSTQIGLLYELKTLIDQFGDQLENMKALLKKS